jgi:hypothetical protein
LENVLIIDSFFQRYELYKMIFQKTICKVQNEKNSGFFSDSFTLKQGLPMKPKLTLGSHYGHIGDFDGDATSFPNEQILAVSGKVDTKMELLLSKS